MMKKSKKTLSIVLSLVLCVFCIISTTLVHVTAVDDYSYKFDEPLKSKINSVNNNNCLQVSIWFKDIDHTTAEEKTIAKVEKNIDNKNLISNALDVISFAKNTEINNFVIEKAKEKTSISEINQVVSIKRNIYAQMYKESNDNYLESILPYIDANSIIYVSHYSPNVLASLKKEQIIYISKLDFVENINYYNKETETLTSDIDGITNSTRSSNSYYSFSSHQFDMTGVSTMRDNYGFTGEGVKIGVIDYPFAKSDEIDYFKDDTFALYYCHPTAITDAYSSHGNLVSCIIAGDYTNTETGQTFYGAVPDAKIYATAGINFREALEKLIDNGVNVINSSLTFGTDGYNNYGDTSKWIDHIVSNHNVIFIGAAANEGENKVGNAQMGYNAITVGSCDNNGEISDFSSYSTSSSHFKPDLLAPGENIILPATRDSSSEIPRSSSGTSISTPVVTGAVAQLCQASPLLATNPRLMKAVLLAGTEINNYMDKNELITDSSGISNSNNDFSRQYGAGNLNVINSYELFSLNQRYIDGSITPVLNTVEYNMYIDTNGEQLIRVCTVFNKHNVITGDHISDPIISPDAEPFALYVTTPENKKYTAYSKGDSKLMVSFLSSSSGTYKIQLFRTGLAATATTKFAIAASVQNYE